MAIAGFYSFTFSGGIFGISMLRASLQWIPATNPIYHGFNTISDLQLYHHTESFYPFLYTSFAWIFILQIFMLIKLTYFTPYLTLNEIF